MQIVCSPIRFHRVVLPVFLVLLLLLAPGTLARRAGTSTAIPATMDADLPAMLLYPDDFNIDAMVGSGGYLLNNPAYADFLAPQDGNDVTLIAKALDEAEFHGAAVMVASVPSTTDREGVEVQAGNLVAEYEDLAGAENGYDLAVDAARKATSEDIAIEGVGDQSTLVRTQYRSLNPVGEVVQHDIVVQVDRFVGTVGITWYDDAMADELPPDEIVGLAETLVDRILDAGDNDATTALTLVRLDGIPGGTIDWYQEQFDIRDGDVIHMMGDDPEVLGSLFAFWHDSSIDEIYRVSMVFAGPSGTYPTFASRAFDIGRSRAAERWVHDAATFFIEGGSPDGYNDFSEPDQVPGFDVDVTAVTYAWASEATGMRVWFAVDGVVYSMEADGPNGINEEVFFGLVEMQIECAEDGRYCEPIPAPADLYR